jgi:valyl-tRNA synthetase
MAKPALYGEDESLKRASRLVLQESLGAILRLIHPFMPFATEEIWQRLPASQGSVMTARFPDASDFISDPRALKEMDLVIGVITGVRNIRGEMNIGPSKRVDIVIEVPDEEEANIIRQNMVHIQNLGKVDSVIMESKVSKPEASATAVFGQNQIHVLLKGLLDFNEERKRLKKEIKKIEKDMEISAKKLSKREFVEKAPPEIVAQVKMKAESMRLKLEKLNQNLDFFESIDE